jgi:predicted TIM-barrel fold metal-dependent hydrolase
MKPIPLVTEFKQPSTENKKTIMKAAHPIIDCDIHQDWASDQVQQRLPLAFRQQGWRNPVNDLPSPIGVMRADAAPDEGGAGTCPRKMIEQHLDPFGITKAILTGSAVLSLGVHANVHYAAAVARAYNDTLAETWLQEDERFYGSIIVTPQDPQAAAEEIRRWAGHPRMVQVLMASAARIPFGQKFYWPIYEAASECGFPVSTHPGTETCGIGNNFIAGSPSTYLEWHTNIPQNYMGHVVSLLCEGVFEKFPKLKFVCIEGGLAWIPHVLWRLDKNWKALRSSVPWVKKLPSEYVWEHVRFTTQPIEEPENPAHLQAIFEMIKAERTVMFSSDYPHWDNDSPTHGLPKLPQELAERIYYKNAEELYNFSQSAVTQKAADPVLVK